MQAGAAGGEAQPKATADDNVEDVDFEEVK